MSKTTYLRVGVIIMALALAAALVLIVVVADPAEARSRFKTFTKTEPIAIPGATTAPKASPYPSELTVSGFPRGSRITDVNLKLNNFRHDNPDDVAVMLAKEERNQGVMADAGGGTNFAVNDITFTLDDEAADTLPDPGPLSNGLSYKPARFGGDWPSPAPSALSVFDGMNPNGTWQLFVVDDGFNTLSGALGGWTLEIKARIPRR